MSLISILYSIASCLNYTRFYIRGLITLNYTFNMPFKGSFNKAKAIINGGFIFQFHNGIHIRKFSLLSLEMFFKKMLFLLK